MAIVELPFIGGDGNYKVTATLDNEEYIFTLFWNQRGAYGAGVWLMSIYEIDNTPVALGIAVVLGTYLGSSYPDQLFKDGVFVAVDNGPKERDATLYDLGSRVIVNFIPVLDLLTKLSFAA